MSRQQLNNKTLHSRKQAGATRTGLLLSLLLVAGMLTLAWFMLPQGYNTDTSLIGKGKPAIVLIYDSDSVLSSDLMSSFNEIRGAHENQVEFLLADLNAPGGREFANSKGMSTAGALFFSGEGRLLGVLNGLQEKEVLDNAVRKTFNLP